MQIDRPIAIAVGIFLTIVLAFFLVSPQYDSFKSLRLKLGEKKAEFNAQTEYYAEITAQHAELDSRKEDIAKIDDALPTTSEFGNLVYYLQDQATANGLIVKNLFLSKTSAVTASGAPATSKSASNMTQISFSLNMLGTYPALENYLSSLENSSRMFEIRNISFGSQTTTTNLRTDTQFQGQQTYNFSIGLITYTY